MGFKFFRRIRENYKAVVRRLVGSFVKEGTSEGAYEALHEAEAFDAVRDRLISMRDVSFDVQQQCERLKNVARQVLTALNQKPKTDNDKVSTIHMDRRHRWAWKRTLRE